MVIFKNVFFFFFTTRMYYLDQPQLHKNASMLVRSKLKITPIGQIHIYIQILIYEYQNPDSFHLLIFARKLYSARQTKVRNLVPTEKENRYS